MANCFLPFHFPSDAEGEKERAKLVHKISLLSLTPHQAGGSMLFEDDGVLGDGVSINSNAEESRNGLDQVGSVESKPDQSFRNSNSLTCAGQNLDSPDKSNSIKLDNCLPPENKIGSTLGITNSLNSQPISLTHLTSSHFCLNPTSNPPAPTFLKIDRNLIQSSSSVGLLIVSRVDANKLVQQTHSLSLSNKSNLANVSPQSCPNGSNGSPFLNDLDRFSLSHFGLSNNLVGQHLPGCTSNRTNSTIDGRPTNNQLFIGNPFHLASLSANHAENGANYPNCNQNSQMSVNRNQISNESNRSVCQAFNPVNSNQLNAENDGQPMSFLEHCPNGGPFSIQPVKCY